MKTYLGAKIQSCKLPTFAEDLETSEIYSQIKIINLRDPTHVYF